MISTNKQNKPAAKRRARAGTQESKTSASFSSGHNGTSEAGAAKEQRLTFDITPGSKGSHKVTARIGDIVVGVDTIDVAKAKDRDKFIESLCEHRPDVDRDEAIHDLLALAAAQQDAMNDEAAQPDAEDLLSKMPLHVREAARATLESPDLMQCILDDAAACGIAGEHELVASIYFVGVSRLLPQPVSVIVQSQSSTGKSFTVDTTAELFPAEVKIPATSMTPKSMIYMKPGALRNKFSVNGERSRRQDDETADATKMRREMQSSGKISQLVPIKTTNGELETVLLQQVGPMSFVETTTRTEIFNEDANRCLLLAADERPEQTARIIDSQADRACGAVPVDIQPIIEIHHAMQRMLQPCAVVIPFAHEIKERFKGNRVEARRAFPQLIAMIRASALLHQFQRQVDEDGRVIAEQFDYDLAACLCHTPFARLLEGRTSAAAQRFLAWLERWTRRKCFTPAEAAIPYGVTKVAVQGWLNELKDSGTVEVAEPHRGSQPAKWAIIQDEIQALGFASTCDNESPSKPNLAQILGKHRDKSNVPSESCGGTGA